MNTTMAAMIKFGNIAQLISETSVVTPNFVVVAFLANSERQKIFARMSLTQTSATTKWPPGTIYCESPFKGGGLYTGVLCTGDGAGGKGLYAVVETSA